ncbi:MAG: metal ABC transporter permease [Acidobacteriia bacterium]|nr:metal ABC transporter permease [Terriglobia bacterium]
MNIAQAFSYPPILRGFLALVIAGCFFPMAGVFILRLNLVTLRFTLMHAALLGAAVGLALHVDPLFAGLALDVLAIIAIARVARESGLTLGYAATFFMVLTIGLAFAVIYKAGVPSKDAFGILWGSVYSLSRTDLVVTAAYAVAIALFVAALFPRVSAVLFHREIAFASGVNEAAPRCAKRPDPVGALFFRIMARAVFVSNCCFALSRTRRLCYSLPLICLA